MVIYYEILVTTNSWEPFEMQAGDDSGWGEDYQKIYVREGKGELICRALLNTNS